MPYHFSMIKLVHSKGATPKETPEALYETLHQYFKALQILNTSAQVYGITYLPCNNAMIQLNNMELRDDISRVSSLIGKNGVDTGRPFPI